MNERLKELMIEAGYAAPELAGRAQKLAELIIKDCIHSVNTWSDEVPCSEGYDIFAVSKIKEKFGLTE